MDSLKELASLRWCSASGSISQWYPLAIIAKAPHIAKICWNDQANTYFGICFKEEERAAIAADLLFVWRDGRYAACCVDKSLNSSYQPKGCDLNASPSLVAKTRPDEHTSQCSAINVWLNLCGASVMA